MYFVTGQLRKGAELGESTIAYVSKKISEANEKAAAKKDIKEKTDVYKDLGKEVKNINNEYVRKSSAIRENLEWALDALEAKTNKTIRRAEIKAAAKNLAAAIMGKKAEHTTENQMRPKDLDEIQRLHSIVENNRNALKHLKEEYQANISEKSSDLNEAYKTVTEIKGKDASIFSKRVENAMNQASGNAGREMKAAEKMLEETEKRLSSQDTR